MYNNKNLDSKPSRREVVTISNCPLCGKNHEHKVDVEGDPVTYMLTGPVDFHKDFEIYLTCPNKNEPFKANIRIDTFGLANIKIKEKK